MTRSMVRKKNRTLIGYASMTEQLRWCKMAGIRCAIFTHCGSPIVRGDAGALSAAIRRLGRKQGIDACLACDGNRLSLSAAKRSGSAYQA